ncbi:hypothetical protein CP10139811_0274 [Chlamydia ibidis]|uniref:Uncharacterized protein n=2 Tax=Chlamydia ibidis TaxID=1405396 RepID=S7KKT2_9CHLA|nr:hypothetical protein CP10139811_0274 [Chlamydia ibidis]EQM62542.1 hypothetical protein H359_0721 [Chlamydia ibidis 10-1398/6]
MITSSVTYWVRRIKILSADTVCISLRKLISSSRLTKSYLSMVAIQLSVCPSALMTISRLVGRRFSTVFLLPVIVIVAFLSSRPLLCKPNTVCSGSRSTIRTGMLFKVLVIVTLWPTRSQMIIANPRDTTFLSQFLMINREKKFIISSKSKT